MKLHNKKTGKIIDSVNAQLMIITPSEIPIAYLSINELIENWEDVENDKPAETLIKEEKIRKLVRAWAEYNETESMYAYNLVYDHGGVCIKNALVRFYDPRLRTDIDVWFKTKAPTFEQEREYTITELCGEEEE